MHPHLWLALGACCTLLSASAQVTAASEGKNPFTMKRFDVVMVDSMQHRARLTLIAETAGSGEVTIALDLPPSDRPDDRSTKLLAGERIATVQVRERGRIECSWEIILPHDGYIRMAEASLLYTPGTASEAQRYERADGITLYAKIEKGVLTSADNSPDRRFVHAPVDISPSMKSPSRAIASSQTFQITITGQVRCQSAVQT